MDRRLIAMLHREATMLRRELAEIDPTDAAKPGRTGSGISPFIIPFNDLLNRTNAALGEDRTASLSLEATRPVDMFDEDHWAGEHKTKKMELMTGFVRIIALLESLLAESPITLPMQATREGIFFGGEYFEPLRLLVDLIKQAGMSIAIIDGYIGDGEKVLGLLSGKAKGVKIQILTYETQQVLLTLAQAFNKEHGGLEIRFSRAFHDRFVILDDRDFYHFGGSLKDMGVRGFMFSRIEEPEVVDKIRTKFAEEWGRAAIKI